MFEHPNSMDQYLELHLRVRYRTPAHVMNHLVRARYRTPAPKMDEQVEKVGTGTVVVDYRLSHLNPIAPASIGEY